MRLHLFFSFILTMIILIQTSQTKKSPPKKTKKKPIKLIVKRNIERLIFQNRFQI